MRKTEQQYKYFAFISYSSKDTEWGRKVQRKLENYRMPSTLCSEHGWSRTPIRPIFFAPSDIQPAPLSEELQERLKSSKNLIVICSPNSAKSEWVGKEIEYFNQLGRSKQIHYFIVDGKPHSGNPDTECFNPIIDKLGLPEILGANIHERTQTYPFSDVSWPWLDKERAYVQLISKLLDVEFDAIWQRHKRQVVEKIIACTLGVVALLSILIGIWIVCQPVNVKVQLKEVSVQNDQLPPLKDAVVTIMLDNKTEIDTMSSIEDCLVFKEIAYKHIGRKTRISVNCQDYIVVDTTLTLNKNIVINISRDPSVYGNVNFRLWNTETEKPIVKARMEIAGQTVMSDDSGRVSLFVPLEKQRKAYHIKTSIPLVCDTIYWPCGPDAVISTK